MKEKIEAILVKYDPVKLIKMGSPKDEYAQEAGLIADALLQQYQKNWVPEHVAMVVYEVFVVQFSGGDIYQSTDHGLVKIGTELPSIDKAAKIIGNLESYFTIGQEIKQLLDQKNTSAT